ncbi:PAS domain S-box protein [uncultured Desulfuromonas sp.]|uniref:hybrid sensor histidine kinase/response regulator n=1 Tax=uncultured Desulfuromonas sp. TaxID=181013 RepID=UPI0026147831|nr:PAS domain S-box protein [uncultured Desulfuromonas sp.]
MAIIGDEQTLLVVDDTPDNLFVLEQVIARHLPGCRVITAASGGEGLALAASVSLDGALLDVQMPGMDGIEMCRRLKAEPATASMPVVLITANRASSELKARGLEAGADDFISRPIDNLELVARIKVMLRVRRAEEQLRRANAGLERRVAEKTAALRLYEKAVESTNDLVTVVSPRYEFLLFNQAALDYNGLQREQVLGRPVSEVLGAEAFEATLRPRLDRTLAGETVEFDLLLDYPQRGTRQQQVRSTPMRGEGGRVEGVVAVIRDVTEHRAAEKKIHRLSQFQKGIVDNAHIWMDVLDEDGHVAIWNKAAENISGYLSEEVVGGSHIWGLLYPDETYRSELQEKLGALLRNGGTVEGFETPIRCKDGAIKIIAWNCRVLLDDTGGPMGVVSIGQDITARREAEEGKTKALLETEAARGRIDALLKSVADGIIVTDGDNRIILMNRFAEDLLDLRLEAAFMQPVDKAIFFRPLRDHFSVVLADAKSRVSEDMEWADPGSGTLRTIQVRTFVSAEGPGERGGTITILRDMTREREIERIKREFLSTAAHELRTPLTAVMGFAELLLSGEDFDAQQQREFLEVIFEKTEALERIVDELLDVGRIETGRQIPLEKAPCSIGETIAAAVEGFRPQLCGKKLEISLPEADPRLEVDRQKMVQVLESLLDNAVKYSPGAGQVRIVGAAAGDAYRVSIEDEGIGMSPEQADRAFDKFYRADASSTAVGGLGLGLTVARSIVEAHGGRIWLESGPGEGTRAIFSLPLERLPEAPDAGNRRFDAPLHPMTGNYHDG